MKFLLQNYNEFQHVRWHDYFSIVINEFAVILVRKYDWPGEGCDWLIHVQIMGFIVYERRGTSH